MPQVKSVSRYAEIQALELTNRSPGPKTIRIVSYVEWCLWNAEDDAANQGSGSGSAAVDETSVTWAPRSRAASAMA